jgi:hypothetical protein
MAAVEWDALRASAQAAYAKHPIYKYDLAQVAVPHRRRITTLAANPYTAVRMDLLDVTTTSPSGVVELCAQGVLCDDTPVSVKYVMVSGQASCCTTFTEVKYALEPAPGPVVLHMIQFGMGLHVLQHVVHTGHLVEWPFHAYLSNVATSQHVPWLLLIGVHCMGDPHDTPTLHVGSYLHQLGESLEASGYFRTAADAYALGAATEKDAETKGVCLLNAAIACRRANWYDRAERHYCEYVRVAPGDLDWGSMQYMYRCGSLPQLANALNYLVSYDRARLETLRQCTDVRAVRRVLWSVLVNVSKTHVIKVVRNSKADPKHDRLQDAKDQLPRLGTVTFAGVAAVAPAAPPQQKEERRHHVPDDDAYWTARRARRDAARRRATERHDDGRPPPPSAPQRTSVAPSTPMVVRDEADRQASIQKALAHAEQLKQREEERVEEAYQRLTLVRVGDAIAHGR